MTTCDDGISAWCNDQPPFLTALVSSFSRFLQNHSSTALPPPVDPGVVFPIASGSAIIATKTASAATTTTPADVKAVLYVTCSLPEGKAARSSLARILRSGGDTVGHGLNSVQDSCAWDSATGDSRQRRAGADTSSMWIW